MYVGLCVCKSGKPIIPPRDAWQATALPANITDAQHFVLCSASFWLVSTHTNSSVFYTTVVLQAISV